MNAIAERELTKCYAIMQASRDPMRQVWDKAELGDRHLFCAVARVNKSLARMPWDALNVETRTEISDRVAKMRDWLNKHTAATV
jgi:hypothetical protein